MQHINPLTPDNGQGFTIGNMNESADKALTIGRLARLADVGIDTVRFYERRELLPRPARTAAGYRLYGGDSVDRIRFIRRAKTLGFSLDEIKTLLTLQDSGGKKSSVRELTRQKLDEVDTRITDLKRIRDVLESLAKRCSGHGNVDGCPIIEALSSDESA